MTQSYLMCSCPCPVVMGTSTSGVLKAGSLVFMFPWLCQNPRVVEGRPLHFKNDCVTVYGMYKNGDSTAFSQK